MTTNTRIQQRGYSGEYIYTREYHILFFFSSLPYVLSEITVIHPPVILLVVVHFIRVKCVVLILILQKKTAVYVLPFSRNNLTLDVRFHHYGYLSFCLLGRLHFFV